MGGLLLALLGAAFLLSSITYLAVSKQHRQIVLDRINFRKRRNSGAQTPPRSLSPGKEKSELSGEDPYYEVFPPSRRFTLADVKSDLPTQFKKSLNELILTPTDIKGRCTPWAKPISEVDGSFYTATEFSLDEIKALGDFPDYEALSGVPLPQPYKEFDINQAIPRPYRPFRWQYHQTMSYKKMEPDWWLELENTYVKRIRQRQQLFAKEGKGVLDCLPGCELAAKELMEMCLQFLAARYPQYFRLDKKAMIFYNDILGEKNELKATPPLEVLLNNVPEDFAIMLRNPDNGFYYFRGGMICSALGWNLGSKMAMQLHEIHQPIPDYKEKMQFSMDRYFAKKPTDKPIQRGSWGLEVDEPLYMPPGDPHENYRSSQDPNLELSRLHLRVDWQTLRRLPLSGAVVFNFKAVFTPVTEFRDEPFIPSLILKVLKEGKKSLMEYKNTWHTEHVVVPALEQYEKEQKEKGIVPQDWEPHTLEESPYFPGWEEKWHWQQGF